MDTNSYILETLTQNKNIKYYNACSSECFYDTGNESANEKTKFKPLSPYAIAKVQHIGHQICIKKSIIYMHVLNFI